MTSWTIDFSEPKTNDIEPVITTSDPKFSLPSLAHRIQKIEGIVCAAENTVHLPRLVGGIKNAHNKVSGYLEKIEIACKESEDRLIAIRDNSLCIICLANPRNRAILHGDTAHVCVCVGCCDRLSKCPVCNTRIERIITMFHA